MKNIVLIGMPGAGKSTVGVLLAKTVGYSFTDCDLMIQEQTGELLYRIIEKEGIDAFLAIEDRVIAGLEVSRSVIATGGSAVFGTRAMEHLKSTGTVVYLKLPPEEIERRIRNITTRGIAMNPGETIRDVFAVRAPLYDRWADVTVDCVGCTPEQVIEKILDAVR